MNDILKSVLDDVVTQFPEVAQGAVKAIVDAYADLSLCQQRIKNVTAEAAAQGILVEQHPDHQAALDALAQSTVIVEQTWQLQATEIAKLAGTEFLQNVLPKLIAALIGALG